VILEMAADDVAAHGAQPGPDRAAALVVRAQPIQGVEEGVLNDVLGKLRAAPHAVKNKRVQPIDMLLVEAFERLLIPSGYPSEQ